MCDGSSFTSYILCVFSITACKVTFHCNFIGSSLIVIEVDSLFMFIGQFFFYLREIPNSLSTWFLASCQNMNLKQSSKQLHTNTCP